MNTPVQPKPADLAAAFEGPRGWVEGVRYGFMAFPLAFVALPLYVLWPNHFARAWGVPLAALGALLLAVRLADALIDPLLGQMVDALGRQKNTYRKAILRSAGMGCALLMLGFVALFFPPAVLAGNQTGLLAWAGLALVLTYLAFSGLTVAHQAWGARLGGTAAQRSRVVGWREGLGLAGVVVASVLPTLAGLHALAAALALALAAGWWLWSRAVVPTGGESAVSAAACAVGGAVNGSVEGAAPMPGAAWCVPLRQPVFRRLLAVFVLNGMASAVPATLVLFFVQDRLQAPAALEPLFLGSYFVCAAGGIALWLRAVSRWGLARSWLLGMGLSVAVFAWVLTLGQGDWSAFVLVCMLSGAALGADLVLPAAMLNGLVADLGQRGRSEGVYMGWWSFATKLNLALAAGLALPLLGWLGYAPGQQDSQAVQALSLAYGLLPCVLKLGAAVLLYRFFIRQDSP